MKHSARLQAVWDELWDGAGTLRGEGDEVGTNDALEECADSSCTTGSDNDGSSGFDIFENGYNLRTKASGALVWYVDGEDQAFFFIGTEDAIEAKLRKAVAGETDESEDEEDHEEDE